MSEAAGSATFAPTGDPVGLLGFGLSVDPVFDAMLLSLPVLFGVFLAFLSGPKWRADVRRWIYDSVWSTAYAHFLVRTLAVLEVFFGPYFSCRALQRCFFISFCYSIFLINHAVFGSASEFLGRGVIYFTFQILNFVSIIIASAIIISKILPDFSNIKETEACLLKSMFVRVFVNKYKSIIFITFIIFTVISAIVLYRMGGSDLIIVSAFIAGGLLVLKGWISIILLFMPVAALGLRMFEETEDLNNTIIGLLLFTLIPLINALFD